MVKAPAGRFNITALLDSGADNTMFPLAWAKAFGIDQNACVEDDCNTVGGPAKQYVWSPGLDASVPVMNCDVHLNACFADGLAVVILGRHDFFDAFRVSFDQRAQSFTLQSYQ